MSSTSSGGHFSHTPSTEPDKDPAGIATSSAVGVQPGDLASPHPLATVSNGAPKGPEEADPAALTRLVHGKDDALFGWIETMQLQQTSHQRQQAMIERSETTVPPSFGRLLDAGTGLHSLRWMASLVRRGLLTHYTALTADATMQRQVQQEAQALGVATAGTVVLGNWFDTTTTTTKSEKDHDDLLEALKDPMTGQPLLFDTVLADYLIGALEGFSPYVSCFKILVWGWGFAGLAKGHYIRVKVPCSDIAPVVTCHQLLPLTS